MAMLTTATLSNYFISLLIWAFHTGINQIIISGIIMIILMKIILRMPFLPGLLLVCIAQLFSLTILFFAYGIITYGLQLPYVVLEEKIEKQYTILMAAINFGLVNTLLQALFFALWQYYKHIHLQKIISILFLSNMIGAFFVHKFLPPLF